MADCALRSRLGTSARAVLTQPVLLLVALLVVIFSLASPYFLAPGNWDRLQSTYFPELALLTIASALALLVRGIDLSVAAVSALTAVVVGMLGEGGFGTATSVGIGLLVAVLAGLVNGVLVVAGRISPILTTLVTQLLFAGLAMGITGGRDVSGFAAGMVGLTRQHVAGIPLPFLFTLAVAAVVIAVLHLTVLGRWIYALGGNPQAARLAGVPTGRLTVGVYVVVGFLAGLAGLVAASRYGSANISINRGAELFAITAAILGGVAITGGRGLIAWALLGAFGVGIVQNGMTLLNQPGYLQVVAIGALLIASVLIGQFQDRYGARREARRQLGPVPPAEDTLVRSGAGHRTG